MTKMSTAQRNAILEANNTRGGFTVAIHRGTRTVLARQGLIEKSGPQAGAAWRVTAAGLIAAGVDMDAIHGEALHENALREIGEAAEEQATPRYRHFAEATRQGGSYRGGLDILHAEALRLWNADLHPRANTITDGTAPRRNVARFRQDPYSFSGSQSNIYVARVHLAKLIETDHADAIIADTIRDARALARLAAADRDNPQIKTPGTYTRTSDGWTAELQWVAGGSFAQLIIRDSLGVRAYNRTDRLSSELEDQVRCFLTV